MPGRQSPIQSEMVQGALDMPILQTLVLGLDYGQTIAHAIERGSDKVLQVEHGSLYPGLHRLQNRGWIAAFWGTSENNRKAKYYRLTPEGKKQLAAQTRWEQIVRRSAASCVRLRKSNELAPPFPLYTGTL
jgi:PadR family transcriptional regulator